jgi:hypothetical protein
MMLRYRIRPPYVTMLNWPPRSYDRDGERLGIALEPDIWCRLRAMRRSQGGLPGYGPRLRLGTAIAGGPPRRRLGTRRSNYDGATIIEFKQIEFLDLTLALDSLVPEWQSGPEYLTLSIPRLVSCDSTMLARYEQRGERRGQSAPVAGKVFRCRFESRPCRENYNVSDADRMQPL